MRRFLLDPAFLFVACGGVLFALHTAVSGPEDDRSTIVVTPEVVAVLREQHQALTGTVPDATVERTLVDEWVGQTVLLREAQALGMPESDPIIRQRLLQKMEYLLEDTASIADPDDAQLEAWLAANPQQYMLPPRLSFEHVFFADNPVANAEAAGAAGSGEGSGPPPPARERAQHAREALAGGADPVGLGEPFIGGRRFERRIRAQVVGGFGEEFATVLEAAPIDQWFGPVRSTSGWHVVRVSAIEAERRAPLAEIRDRVVRAWRAEQAEAARQRRIDELRARYAVVYAEGSGAHP